jgi:hypothetical protein
MEKKGLHAISFWNISRQKLRSVSLGELLVLSLYCLRQVRSAQKSLPKCCRCGAAGLSCTSIRFFKFAKNIVTGCGVLLCAIACVPCFADSSLHIKVRAVIHHALNMRTIDTKSLKQHIDNLNISNSDGVQIIASKE